MFLIPHLPADAGLRLVTRFEAVLNVPDACLVIRRHKRTHGDQQSIPAAKTRAIKPCIVMGVAYGAIFAAT